MDEQGTIRSISRAIAHQQSFYYYFFLSFLDQSYLIFALGSWVTQSWVLSHPGSYCVWGFKLGEWPLSQIKHCFAILTSSVPPLPQHITEAVHHCRSSVCDSLVVFFPILIPSECLLQTLQHGNEGFYLGIESKSLLLMNQLCRCFIPQGIIPQEFCCQFVESKLQD